jgi:hypothetical protein
VKLFKSAILLVILVLVGCGKSLKPLTDEQKARFANTMNSGGTLIGSMSTAASKTKANNGVTNTADNLEAVLSGHVQSGQCNAKFNSDLSKSSDFQVNRPFTFEMSISGNGCPIDSYLLTKTQVNQSGSQSAEVDFEMKGHFKIVDSKITKYTDITGFEITEGKGHFSANQTSVKGNASMAANITSTKEGNIAMYLQLEADMNGQSGSSKMKFGVKYSDFTAELEVSGNGQDAQYTLNGEKISAQEFSNYFKGMNNVPSKMNMTL